jgi:glyoxylase-like metal-dependent hydrolase (beta-lactamase superfamily II)
VIVEVDSVLVVGFPAGAFQANCYLLASGPGADCVIVDPGQDAAGKIGEAVREHGLTPVGMLATHGHFDHVRSAAEVGEEHGLPLRLHPADTGLLEDRVTVDPLSEGFLDLAGLGITVESVPGHTAGSVQFRLETPEGGRLVLTGDTLFAGSVGRTDRPGGDPGELTHSLLTKVLTLSDEVVVLPGHGASTTIGRERSANPFLLGV